MKSVATAVIGLTGNGKTLAHRAGLISYQARAKVLRMTTMQSILEYKLTQGLQPTHLDVINESHNHNVPTGSESHFKVVVVSAQFEGKNLVARHRQVYAIVAQELAEHVHALALHTLTPAEWEKKNAAPNSPPCKGGAGK